jgi:hypothetical protein
MANVNRREFLDRSTQGALKLAAGLTVLGSAASAAGQAAQKRPEVVCVYYPHWHNYDHGSSWKGEGWTEWEGVKAAPARFPGHHQPLKPTWGYFDESDPKWTAREIDLAADHGIDVFLYDWYWYSGVKSMEEALEQGFLKASNRGRMKFALMWANHDRRDQFCPEFGKPRTVWLPSRHSPRDLERVADYCAEHYFREPNYWRPGGRLFFSVFESSRFVKELGGPAETRKLLERIDARLARAGLPGMHWNGMVSRPEMAAVLKEAGFLSTSRYNVNTARKVQPDMTERYEDVMDAHREHWKKMLGTPLVDLPVATMGWDATPRCRKDVKWPFPKTPTATKYNSYEYPYVPVVVGNTPERFEQLLRDLAKHAQSDPRQPFAVLLNAWNEWTEGGYLLPEERYGTGYVEAIRRALGKASAAG